jgi:hypothetical protein
MSEKTTLFASKTSEERQMKTIFGLSNDDVSLCLRCLLAAKIALSFSWTEEYC